MSVSLFKNSLTTVLSDHKSPGWWQRRMWEHFLSLRWRPGLVMDGQTAVLGGASGHMFGQEMGVSSPDQGGEEIEPPLSDGVLDLQQMPTYEPGCSRGSVS